MKVTGIETIRLERQPNLLWCRLLTDSGLVGLGETFYGPEAAEAHIHRVIAPYLIGKDPRAVERHQAFLTGYVGYVGSSAEIRGRSAVDIACWDILGQAANLPLCDLWGGRVREDIRAYNTCAGYSYVQTEATQGTGNFGLGEKAGPYEDLKGFLERPVEVAESLLEMGISAMKIWPFDYAAEASQGQAITTGELKQGLVPFEKIRAALGDRIDLMAELHGLWNRPAAIRIARALEPVAPLWVEDPVVMDHLVSLGEVARATRCPIAAGETRGTRADFRAMLELEALSTLILDLSWCGGISEARKVAAMAEAWHVPVAFHDCTGPVVLAASTHLALHARNCAIQEIVRAFYYGWYGELVTALPPLANGRITVPEGPGLGLALNAGVPKRADARVRRTTAADL
ncbi:MAG: mandelate racemase/muconate lactonizing enzyme family protein [Acetobacteraceae bacterium]|nr:mandelate racemase/muconate lactonizing enzyme family protein [Acetobacteraceae bacterium]